MDLIFCKLQNTQKNRKVIFYKLKKIKNIDSILRDLSKAQKTFI